jgi:hypothetical protein
MRRKPATGYAALLLLIASVGALSGVFMFEMLLGRFLAGGSNQAAAVVLLETFQSRVFVALLPGLLGFFVGSALAMMSLASTAGPFRMPHLLWRSEQS